MNLTDVIVGW